MTFSDGDGDGDRSHLPMPVRQPGGLPPTAALPGRADGPGGELPGGPAGAVHYVNQKSLQKSSKHHDCGSTRVNCGVS